MNCAEFRRRLLEDPASADPEFLAHREACPACAAEAQEVERIEAALARVVKVTPPADLKNRLRPHHARAGWSRVALAASLTGLLAIATVLWLRGGAGYSDAGLIAELIEHLDHEPQAFASHEPLPVEQLRHLSPAVSVEPAGLRHPVTYAMPCELMHLPGLHLVLQLDDGPVSLLVVSEQHIDEPRLVHQRGYRGVVRPIAHGSLAVFGPERAPVEDLAQAMAPYLKVEI